MKSLAEQLAALSEDDRNKALALLSEKEASALLYDWRGFLARPEQVMPEGDWEIWCVLAGRGAGKTRTGAEAVREEVETGRSSKIGLIAETAADARDVMVAELLKVFPPDQTPVYTKSNRCVTFQNGAKAFTYSALDPDQLRGPQHDFLWCFIAGTRIETQNGTKPIQNINTGDMVLTRRGYRRVTAAGSRRKIVGRVAFSNGEQLVGTADHPVYTSLGWTRMDQLCEGNQACAINASNGAAPAGISTAKGAGHITNDPPRLTAAGSGRHFTGKFGQASTALSQAALTFITWMGTAVTTTLKTSPLCLSGIIPGFTPGYPQFRRRHGTKSHWWHANAAIAAQQFTERQSERRFVPDVRASAVNAAGNGQNAIACNAADRSQAEPETFAVSVASTWQPLGEQDVYCLTVEEQPEYFANGILVHNCDELAKWKYARNAWDMAQFGLRLGKHPRQVVTTTPRPIELVKAIISGQEGRVHITRGSTMDNRANLAKSFMERIYKRYEGTRLGRQELEAELLSDLSGALWPQAIIDTYRVEKYPDLQRIVVAVDPAVTNTEDSDEHGVVVVGTAEDQTGYVIDDATLSGSPREWASAAVAKYHEYQADGIVVEVNQGGDMVAHTLRSVSPNVKIIEVRASKGKHIRAEPVAALYEQGRIRHVGQFAELENQMTQFTNAGYQGGDSPDRVDALVWACSELFPDMVSPIPDVSRFYAQTSSRGFFAT